jgi:hypothetical protein
VFTKTAKEITLKELLSYIEKNTCSWKCLICFFRLHFSLVRLGQNGHWNWGSLPHSSRWCLTNDVFHRYFLSHALHLNPSMPGTGWQYLGTLLCFGCHSWYDSGSKHVPVRRPNSFSTKAMTKQAVMKQHT